MLPISSCAIGGFHISRQGCADHLVHGRLSVPPCCPRPPRQARLRCGAPDGAQHSVCSVSWARNLVINRAFLGLGTLGSVTTMSSWHVSIIALIVLPQTGSLTGSLVVAVLEDGMRTVTVVTYHHAGCSVAVGSVQGSHH